MFLITKVSLKVTTMGKSKEPPLNCFVILLLQNIFMAFFADIFLTPKSSIENLISHIPGVVKIFHYKPDVTK